MKKAILTLAFAAVASSSMSGFAYGPAMASTTDMAPSTVNSYVVKKTFTAEEVNSEANRLAEAEDWAGLVNFSEEVIAANPNMAEGYFYRAAGVWNTTGEVNSMISDLNKAIKLNPQYAEALAARATVEAAENDYESAVSDWMSVLAIVPDNLFVLGKCMDLHATLQDWSGLEQDYTHWISLEPENPEAYYDRAMVRAYLGDIQNAIADLETTSELLVAYGEDDAGVQTLIAKLKNGEAIG